jgi:hypothetical protein
MSTFRINPRPATWATVKVNAPGEDGIERQSFRARFLILPEEERQALAETPREAMRQVWLDWDGITDIDGKPVPFSETAREQLMGYSYITLGVAEAYQRATAGIETKN